MSEFLPVKSIYTGADVTALGEAASDDVMLAPGGGIKYPDGSIQITASGGSGAEGPAGPEGPQGIQGETGPAGADGATGPKGDTGDTGPAGADGAQGPAGAEGLSAYEVAVTNGYPGTEAEWVASLEGPAGADGVAGPKGDKGDTGPAGADGAVGPKGDTGEAGPAGADSTVPGPKGDPGETGPAGADGAAGPKGDPGETGPAGADGAAGPKGDTGETGPAGADGAQGPAGADGVAGPKGDTGETGPAGADGAQGPAGPKGDTGDTGPAGPAGADSTVPGPQGPKGDTGDTGPAGPAPDVSQFVKKAGDTMTGTLNIGATGSDHQLTVKNTAAGTSNDAIILIQTSSTGTTSTISGFYFGDNDSASTGQLRYNHSDDSMAFYTAGAERVRFSSSGELALGKSGYTASGTGVVIDDAGLIRITRSDTISNTNIQFNNNGGTEVGRIATAASATSYLTSSDYRLKESIAPMTGALEKVAALKPCTYKWKSTGEMGQGFIAHELQAVVPECVVGAKDAVETLDDVDAEGLKIGTKEVPAYQGIDTSFLVATLVAAIQEQQTLIAQLQADVAALKPV
jgi:hypothetical protein